MRLPARSFICMPVPPARGVRSKNASNHLPTIPGARQNLDPGPVSIAGDGMAASRSLPAVTGQRGAPASNRRHASASIFDQRKKHSRVVNWSEMSPKERMADLYQKSGLIVHEDVSTLGQIMEGPRLTKEVLANHEATCRGQGDTGVVFDGAAAEVLRWKRLVRQKEKRQQQRGDVAPLNEEQVSDDAEPVKVSFQLQQAEQMLAPPLQDTAAGEQLPTRLGEQLQERKDAPPPQKPKGRRTSDEIFNVEITNTQLAHHSEHYIHTLDRVCGSLLLEKDHRDMVGRGVR